MKCGNCNSDIDFRLVEKKKININDMNPSFTFYCGHCGAENHVKCRHKTGKKRSVKISQPSFA
jgi:uncharacterized Zn finger protein